jgi:hypothetical protein
VRPFWISSIRRSARSISLNAAWALPRGRAAWACRVCAAAAAARLLVSSFARSSAAASLFGACRVDVCPAECVEMRSLSMTRSRSSMIA